MQGSSSKGKGELALSLFNFFQVSHLLLAKLCYAFQEKKIFCHHDFMKKSHFKLSKNEPKCIPKLREPDIFVKDF